MVASFHCWETSPVLHTLTSRLTMKVPENLRVDEYQYFSWEGVWSYRFPVRLTHRTMSSMVGSTPSDGAKCRRGNRTVIVRSS